MFESRITSPVLSEAAFARNHQLVLTKALLAAATEKSDELAELQARLEAQRSGILWLRWEIKAALNRALKAAKAENPNALEIQNAEDTVIKGIRSANNVILRATAVIIESERTIAAITALIEGASAEMKNCLAHSDAEIEDRHITAEKLSRLSADILGLIKSVRSLSREITTMEEENQKDSVAEGQLREARRVLRL